MSAAAYIASILADTPAALWECQDAGGNPADSSGNGRNMTSTGGAIAYRDPGPFGTDFSIRLGAGGFALLPFFSNATNNMSCEVWSQVVSTPTGINAALFRNAQASGSSGIAGWTLDVATDRRFQAVVQGIVVLPKSANALPAPGAAPGPRLLPMLGVGGGGGVAPWSMVDCVRDAGTWRYYFDGAVDTLNAGGNTPNAMTAGGVCGFGDPGQSWDGRYAYVSYFTSALSPARVAAHFAAAQA